jgi:adenylate cyclase
MPVGGFWVNLHSTFKLPVGPVGRALLTGLVALGAITALSFTNPGQNLENRALDFCYTMRPVAPPPPELLIVGIDEASFQELKKPWPWPRHLHATLIKRLSEAGARLIVFDVLFADPTTPEDDRAFAEAMHKAGNVILARTIEKFESPLMYRQTLVEPLEAFCQAANGIALFVVTPDADGVVRRFRLSLGGLDTMPALVVRLLQPQAYIHPDLSGLINFAGPPGSIETISYYQALDEHNLPAAKIRNRIILVGRILSSTIDPLAHADNFYTPFILGNRQSMSGVEMQANIISTLLRGAWGQEMPGGFRLALYLLLMLPFSLVIARLSPLSGLVVLLFAVILIGFVSLSLFLMHNFWMPPALAILGLTMIYSTHALGQLLREVREKRWLRQAFSRYVSPSIVEDIAAHPERLELGGEEVDATVLFADLTDFTTLSENMPPKEIIHILDEHFTVMTQIILANKGTVDKYIGDAIMCFWGAPVPQRDHAVRACRAALEMQQAMRSLNKSWRDQGNPLLMLRIGIHSGRVVAGNVGSKERFNYTVMGDTVNLTYRLEKVNKFYGSQILLSEATHRLAKGIFIVRELDRIMVKGRMQPVTLYELLGYQPEDNSPPELILFAQGLEAYRLRNWQQAVEHFQEVLRLNPQDGPARLYHERASQFLQTPPPSNWPCIHTLENKE